MLSGIVTAWDNAASLFVLFLGLPGGVTAFEISPRLGLPLRQAVWAHAVRDVPAFGGRRVQEHLPLIRDNVHVRARVRARVRPVIDRVTGRALVMYLICV